MAKNKDKEVKTNAMRILDKNKISYETITYAHGREDRRPRGAVL